MRHPRFRSTRLVRLSVTAVALTAVVLAGAIQAVPASAAPISAVPHPAFGKPVKGHHAAPIAAVGAGKSSTSAPAATAVMPSAAQFTVVTPATGAVKKLVTKAQRGAAAATVDGAWQSVGGTGLHVAAARGAVGGSASKVKVSVLDAATVKKHGLKGLVVELSRADGKSDPAPVAVQLSSSLLSGIYGADYASRLQWVQLPASSTAGTSTATPVASTMDARTRSVVVTPIARSGAVMLAATGTPVSTTGTGSFAATPLSLSSTWDVSGQTGDFTWQYPLRVPPAPAGPQPALALSYDSQSIDGETGSTNNQPSAIGEGWNLAGAGFIERTYVPCSLDSGASGPVTTSGDQCWKTDNATLSLAGHSGQLVKDTATGTWRLQSDDDSRFEHLTNNATLCGNTTYDHDCWRMTTTDGTQYYFGMNKLPTWTSTNPVTNSTWTVPVYGNDAGEPCHGTTFAASSCVQAWRWNLDYVVDVHGNAEALYYDAETNKYAQNGSGAITYTRGGQLDHIDYGLRSTNIFGSTAASGRVTLGYDAYGRCSDAAHTNCTSESIKSAATAPAHPTYYPDVPFDQLCTVTTGSCTQKSPSFFTDGMLDTVTTSVLLSGAYQTVDTWTLSHSFPNPGDTTNAALWMTQIVHAGSAAGQTSLSEPPTVFSGITMQNRVSVTDGLVALEKYRITSIKTSLGGVISVNYSTPQCTPAGAAAIEASPWSNTNRCFPEWWTPGVLGAQVPRIDLFHKYVVTSTVSNPTTGGALQQPVETDYVYGTPRWRYDTSSLTPDKERTWNQYAGFDTLEIRVGDHNVPSAQQVTDYTYYQGMDGDRASATGGTKSVDVKGTTIPDSRWFGGQVYEQKTLLGVGGAVLSDTVTTPWASAVTANDGTNTARITDVQDSVTTEPTSSGASRSTETKTTFTSDGFPLTVSTVPSDASSTCTTTSYATANTSAWIVGLPEEVEQVGVACADVGSATLPQDLVSDVRTYYDAAALGVIGAHGDVTSTSEVDSYVSGSPHWVTASVAAYDALGRVTSSADVLGHTTTTAYTPAAGGPVTSMTVTNPLTWTTTTALNPEWGAETSYTDQNGHVTTATYDSLGRRTQVWLPQHTQAAYPSGPSIKYAYVLSQTGANAITTTTLTGGGQGVEYDLYDGLGHEVQSQTVADGGGTIVSSNAYDAAGRAYWKDNAYWTTSVSPSVTLFVPTSESVIPSQVQTTFDGAGRQTRAITSSNGAERFETDSAYLGADRVDTTPPVGGTATSVFTNSLGEKTKLVQYLGATVSGTGQSTVYAYDATGAMTGMTDPAGNHWTWSHDVLGHQTSATDPDTGTTASTFDDAGNQITSTDARGQLLTYSYDALNRRTAEYAGSTSGSLLAAWTYDSVAKGDLTTSTSYVGSTPGVPGAAYSSTVNTYDAADHPTSTTLTIPSAAPAFGGTTYTVTNAYTQDGQVGSQTDPAAGGLPSEHVAYTFTADGRVNGLTGTGITSQTQFTPIRQLGTINRYVPVGLFDNPQYEAYTSYGYDVATGAVLSIRDNATFASTGHGVASRVYTRDAAGDITSATNTTTYPTSTTEVSCYSHDGLGELTQVFTPGSGSSCATAPSASVLGGPAPLWDTYTYDTATGNRTGVTVHDTSGSGSDVSAGYSYPVSGAARPHGVTAVSGTAATGAGSYGYDADGNMTSAPGQTLAYDASGKLASVTTAAGTQRDVYDASGSLLLQVDAGGAARLFLGDTVLTQSAAGVVSGVRTYSSNGVHIAEVSATAGVSGSSLTWLFSDVDGTVDTQTVATTGATSVQYRDPFGVGVAGSSGVWGDGFGFLNKPQSTATGLASFGDRFYDATLGRFTSADPVLATGNPQQVNGYSYAANDPVTNTDPSGDCYETGAVSDYLTHTTNCANGAHGANAAGAVTAPGASPVHGSSGGSRAGRAPAAASGAHASSGGPGSWLAGGKQAALNAVHTDPALDPALSIVGGIVGGVIIAAAAIVCVALTDGACAIPLVYLATGGDVALTSITAIDGLAALGTGGAIGAEVGAASEKPLTPKVTVPYSRPSGATTAAQRLSVQNLPCVDCGEFNARQVADHITPLVKEYYETGSVDLTFMRSLEAVQPQCPTCSARQGAELSRYSRQMRELIEGADSGGG